MNKFKYIIVFFVTLSVFSCKKTEPNGIKKLPEGATPYTESDIQFVPYGTVNKVFKKLPLLDSTWVLNFKERLRTEEYFAWDQTFFTFDFDPELELELKLRYLQTDNSQKTLAIYIPYKDATGVGRTNLFEMPLDESSIETSFFTDLVDFHDTISFNGIEWYNVYEVNELLSTDLEKDGPENFKKIFYNKVYGIIEMEQNNGTTWILQQ